MCFCRFVFISKVCLVGGDGLFRFMFSGMGVLMFRLRYFEFVCWVVNIVFRLLSMLVYWIGCCSIC